VTVRHEPSILHVDLDAFYASVEQLADPSLRGRPVVVGGLGNRGVVAAASYEAREYGVHSAMPMARARRACPHAAFLAPRFDAYADASRRVMEVLRAYTPLVEPIAFDEAFLDVAGARRAHGPGQDVAAAIRARVRDETGLVASVGVATTKLLAKLASDSAKPDGLLVVETGTELAFLHPLPVQRLWGVGPATRRRLEQLGVHTVGELAALPETALTAALGDANGRHLHALSHNRDPRPVEPARATKSVGHEETFATDLTDRTVLRREVGRMSERVAQRLRTAGLAARTVQLKVRYGDFRTITRSHTWPAPSDLARDIGAAARALLDGVDVAPGIRLLGVSAQQLGSAHGVQGSLPFDQAGPDAPADDRALEHAVDGVRARFGDDALGPAALLDAEGLRLGPRGSPWGPGAEAHPGTARDRGGSR
jgi:DNA polymerase-4